MKVRGMENLRVVDASAIPRTTNGNIHATPVLMLAGGRNGRYDSRWLSSNGTLK